MLSKKLSYESGHCFLVKVSRSDRFEKFDISNSKYEYDTIRDTMTLLKHIDKPSLLLPYEQIYMQLFHHNIQLIPEQHPNEQNPMFQLLYNRYHTSHPT